MKYWILILLTLLVVDCIPARTNSNVLRIGPVLSAKHAKAVFEKIDSSLKFTESSNEHFGVKDHMFYSSLLTNTSQTTINIGKRLDENKPFTNIYISVSADKPPNERIRKELNGLVAKYVFGFLSNAFDDGHLLRKQINQYIGSNFTNKDIEIESDNYYISYKVSMEDGNPHYITCLLQIIEDNFQKELNQRIIKRMKP